MLNIALFHLVSFQGTHAAAKANLYLLEEIREKGFVDDDVWDNIFDRLVLRGQQAAKVCKYINGCCNFVGTESFSSFGFI